MKYFSILRPLKNGFRFEYLARKNVWFCFISLASVHSSHKTEKCQTWVSLKYFDKKEMATDLDMHYGKIIDFISLPLCGLNLVIKLRNLGFGSNWRDFNIFWSKTDFRFEYFLSNSVWFGLSFVVWVGLWQ